MNRILKRPMFRMGGSAGTGITSGLDELKKMANGGRTGYQTGTNPYATPLAPGTLPGFLTSFGLDLLSRPPQGNIFQTAATAAKGPFETFQMANLRRAETEAEKAFKEKLFKEDEPYMFMGEDENYIYFKHGITRQYKNLIKESVGK